MTYAELLERLQKLSPEQLQQHVTIQLDFEFLPVVGTGVADEDDTLDKGHFYLFID